MYELLDIPTHALTPPLLLAQETAPPPGTLGPGPAQGQQQLTGTTTPGSPAAKRDPFTSQFFLLLLLLFGAMIIFSFLGQRRERKKRQAMINAIKKHDRVQTVGGVIGSILEIKPDTVILKVDESSNIRITFARSSIQQVLSDGPSVPAKVDDE